MIGFFIKKAFFDGWDNLVAILIHNIGHVAILAIFYLGITILPSSLIGGLLVFTIALFLYSLYKGAISFITFEYANYRQSSFSNFKNAFKESFMHSFLLFFINLFILVSFIIIIPFYFAYHNVIGYVVAIFVLWINILLLLSLMYYLPLAKAMLADKPLKSFRKSFIILLDNLGFSFFLGIYSLLTTILSILFAFLIPGFTGLCLLHQDATKLILYKYDYLEEADADRKNIPWDRLLYNDKESVGHRSLKNMIFPWKD